MKHNAMSIDVEDMSDDMRKQLEGLPVMSTKKPASYYTEALKAFRRGAKELIEDYLRRTGEEFDPTDGRIDFQDGLSKLTNRFSDFKIYNTDYGYVVFSENLYKFKSDLTSNKPPYFVKCRGVNGYSIKPFILDSYEDYPYIYDEEPEQSKSK